VPASPVLLLQRRGRHESGAGGQAEAAGRCEERRTARAGAAAWARVGGERPRGAWPDEPDGSRALHRPSRGGDGTTGLPAEEWCSGGGGRRARGGGGGGGEHEVSTGLVRPGVAGGWRRRRGTVREIWRRTGF
jgi:hypothetical protein